MKKYFYTTLFLVFTVLSASALFLTETDVLYYLNGKKFIKESVGATLSFSEMGSQLTVNGNYLMNQPDISILSKSTAVVTYYGIEDQSAKAGLVVNGSTNRIVDRSNNSLYTLANERDNSSSNNGIKRIKRDPDHDKGYANVFYDPSYTLFDLLTDEPIFPDNNGVFHIYMSSNEQKYPQKLVSTTQNLPKILMYKFKNLKNCQDWCKKK